MKVLIICAHSYRPVAQAKLSKAWYHALMNETQREQLQYHIAQVAKWGKHINLTTITDPQAMWSHHVLDSLAVIPFLEGGSFIDMGTGAGFPGLPLAICMPDKQFTLLDSNSKKIHFLRNVIAHLGLKNIRAVHSRMEDYQPEVKADAMISRAVGDMATMCAQSSQAIVDNGRFYWMKGQYPEAELKRLPFAPKVHKLNVPELGGAARHVVIIEKADFDANSE
jgi:16S rRNA (guanine527-N7)-methyltransferase